MENTLTVPLWLVWFLTLLWGLTAIFAGIGAAAIYDWWRSR